MILGMYPTLYPKCEDLYKRGVREKGYYKLKNAGLTFCWFYGKQRYVYRKHA